MNRRIIALVKRNKEKAKTLVRYANPRTRKRPSVDEVKAILQERIPYDFGGEKPTVPPILDIRVKSYSANSIQKSAHIIVTTSHGAFEFSAYQHLVGRTPEEIEADKQTSFPSGLFTIFRDPVRVAVGT
jgi:hypothetical protein